MPPHEQPLTFVTQLKRMIDERPDIIRWSRGDIMIPDPAALERNLFLVLAAGHVMRGLNNY